MDAAVVRQEADGGCAPDQPSRHGRSSGGDGGGTTPAGSRGGDGCVTTAELGRRGNGCERGDKAPVSFPSSPVQIANSRVITIEAFSVRVIVFAICHTVATYIFR